MSLSSLPLSFAVKRYRVSSRQEHSKTRIPSLSGAGVGSTLCKTFSSGSNAMEHNSPIQVIYDQILCGLKHMFHDAFVPEPRKLLHRVFSLFPPLRFPFSTKKITANFSGSEKTLPFVLIKVINRTSDTLCLSDVRAKFIIHWFLICAMLIFISDKSLNIRFHAILLRSSEH